jgi:hypothetical protein
MNAQEFAKEWDTRVRALASDTASTCRTDPAATYYIGQMIFYVEHDLADDRDPTLRLEPCTSTLNDEGYYASVHKSTPAAEVSRLRDLGRVLKELAGEGH